jgi:hypothetical protein
MFAGRYTYCAPERKTKDKDSGKTKTTRGTLPKSVIEIREDAKTQLTSFMQSAQIRDFLSGSTFNIDEAKDPDRVTTFYSIFPGQVAFRYSRFTRVFYSATFNALLRPPRADNLFILDELATSLGNEGLEIINQAFTVGGGYGVRLIAMLQSMAQTKKIWGDETDTILSCCGFQQFMRFRDETTIKHVMNRAGKTTASYTTRTLSENHGVTETGMSEGFSVSRNRHFYEKPVYWSQDLYEYGAGFKGDEASPQLLLFDGIARPVEAWAVPYFHDVLGLKERADPNPFAPPASLPVPVTP